MIRVFTLAASACVLCSACTGEVAGDGSAWPVAKAALELSEVDWNAARTELGSIAAIAEDGDRVIVFGEHGATLIAGGAAAGNDPSVTAWQSASRIAAADGSGSWPVGVAATGEVHRLRAGTSLESVSDRYGLLGDKVERIAALATPYAAFALQDELAIADGTHVTRYAASVASARCLAGDAHRVAFAGPDGEVHVLDVDSRQLTTLPLAGAQSCAFLNGQLWVQTASALFVHVDDDMQAVFRGSRLSGLAVSAERLWFAHGEQLCTAEPDANSIGCGSAKGFAGGSTLFGSASGDVWALRAGGATRYALPAQGDEAAWRTSAFSVYARVCSSCHAPGGSSGIDLSTYASWQGKRDKIVARVLDAKNMPPDRALSEQDRAGIAAWAKP